MVVASGSLCLPAITTQSVPCNLTCNAGRLLNETGGHVIKHGTLFNLFVESGENLHSRHNLLCPFAGHAGVCLAKLVWIRRNWGLDFKIVLGRWFARMKNAFLSMILVGCLAQFAAAQGAVTATHSSSGYLAGDPAPTKMIVTNVFTYPATNVLRALYLTNTLPPGWTLSQNTWGPGTREVHTNFNELTFIGALPTNNPLVFSYEVDVPPNQTGPKSIFSMIGYRFDGQDDTVEIPVEPYELGVKMRVCAGHDPAVKFMVRLIMTYTVTAGNLMPGDVFTGALARSSAKMGFEIQQGTLGINDNYIISYTTNNFEITPLAVQAGGTRVYDGTANANFSILDVINKVGADDVDFVSGVGTLASPNVGLRAIPILAHWRWEARRRPITP